MYPATVKTAGFNGSAGVLCVSRYKQMNKRKLLPDSFLKYHDISPFHIFIFSKRFFENGYDRSGVVEMNFFAFGVKLV